MNIWSVMNSADAFICSVSIIVSLIICFYGYTLYKFFVRAYGFIALSTVGAIISGYIGLSTPVFLIVSIIFGLLGAVCAVKYHETTVFITVLLSVYAVIYSLTNSIPLTIIFSLIAGFLSINFIKPVVSVSTATYGAMVISASVESLFPNTVPIIITSIGVGLSIFGSYKQIKRKD